MRLFTRPRRILGFSEVRSVESRGAYAWLVLAPAGVTTIAATWSSLR